MIDRAADVAVSVLQALIGWIRIHASISLNIIYTVKINLLFKF